MSNTKSSIKLIFGILVISLAACQIPKDPINTNGEIRVNSEVIYPKFRVRTSPSTGEEPKFNSPSLQWPVKRNTMSSVRLSSSKNFSADLIEKDNIPYAIFNPHKKLDEGMWYWQYKTGNNKWNKIDSFLISASTPEFLTPDLKKVIAGVSSSHPRVLARKIDLEELRLKAKSYTESADIILNADKYLGIPTPKEKEGIPAFKGKNDFENEKIALKASKRLSAEVYETLTYFNQAYILTGDKKYFNTAKTWMLEVAEWDPNGLTKLSNFGDAGIMSALALGVDTFWDLLTDYERKKIINHVTVRANGFYNLWRNYVETRSSSMHVWQHILHHLFNTSHALVGEVDDADKWMEYIYELWIAQSPKMAEQDGAWFNGTGYFRLNTVTMYDISFTLKEISGVDFMRSAWYANNPKWLIYAYPPNSVSDGFCNGSDGTTTPSIEHAGYADVAARVQNDPYAAWYAKECADVLGLSVHDASDFNWFRVQRSNKMPLPSPLNKFDLPQAAVFPEVGVAYMHTSVQDSKANLMFSMRSSPFGSVGHTHAEQNGFNIAFGGKRLFYNTGYRVTMGDPHFLAWYKHTQGHNAVLIDGKGQPFNAGAYGWIPRFIHGKQISYTVGDASNAYSGSDEGESIDYEMKCFRRHYIMLRPSIIVIYDELEADHDAEWSWLLHNDKGLIVDSEKKTILAENELANAQVSLFSSSEIDYLVSDQFSVPVENWIQKKDKEGNLVVFKNQWHFKGVSKSKTPKMRYLSIIQVKSKSGESVCEEVVFDEKTNAYSVGDWNINAEMNAELAARIEVSNNAGTAALVSSGTLNFQNKKYKGEILGSSKLAEIINGRTELKEQVDEVPASIKSVMGKK